MPNNPYATQLRSFTSSKANARRGLLDLYKEREQGVRRTAGANQAAWTDASTRIGASYAGAEQRLGALPDEVLGQLAPSGYQMGAGGQQEALRGIVAGGSEPYRAFNRGAVGAERAWMGSAKRTEGEAGAYLREGLLRERTAAQSELESGIVDTVGFLQQASSAFQQQQQLLSQQQNFYRAQTSQMAQQYGGGGTSPAEQFLIGHESSGRTTAQNPTSSAFGLGQLIRSNRVKYGAELGVSPDTTNGAEQLAMMRRYIEDRYGTAEAAAQFWRQHGWY